MNAGNGSMASRRCSYMAASGASGSGDHDLPSQQFLEQVHAARGAPALERQVASLGARHQPDAEALPGEPGANLVHDRGVTAVESIGEAEESREPPNDVAILPR